MSIGKKIWVFPDGDLPMAGDKEPYGHESLVIVNTTSQKADINITVYRENEEPAKNIKVGVDGERVRCVRLDKEIGDDEKVRIAPGQYALKLESNVPVVAQIGRMDVTQSNLAYYTVMGYSE